MNHSRPVIANGRQRVARRLRGYIVIAAATLGLTSPLHAQEAAVSLRPGGPGAPSRQITGIIESVGAAGIVVRTGESPNARRTIISLGQIVSPSRLGAQPGLNLDDLATRVWRANGRVERGDCQSAEPLLDALAPVLIPVGGPAAATTAEGLLTCRLARDARASALFAWLDWLRIVRAGPGLADAPAGSLVAPPAVVRTTWEGGVLSPRIGNSPIDRATGLVPLLPPIWVPGAATESITGAPDWARLIDASDQTTTLDPLVELCLLYRAAVEADCGRSASLPARAAALPGVAIVRDIVAGRIGDEAARAAARESMSARAASPDCASWVDAWTRAGIGRSLIIEPDAELNRLGVLELLHVPARFSRTQPHLAAMALAEASITLSKLGDAPSAAILRAELLRAFADHPAARWASESTTSGGANNTLYDLLVALPIASVSFPQPTDPESEGLIPVGPDDALEAYLLRLGLTTLLAEHLELRLTTLSRERRTAVAERLAKLYVNLLEAATESAARTRWESKADALLKEVPEAEGYELRISLSRALYVRAEDICERNRLRLASGDETAEAERVLRQLEPQLREIAVKVHRRVDTLERIEKQGDATDELNRQLADARRVRSLAFYYSGWCSYYLSMLTRSEPPAIEALKSFGWLLNSPNGRLATLDRIPTSLLRYEHVARAAMGCALAAAARGNDDEAMAWLEAVEEAEDLVAPVKAQLLLRKISILGDAKRWSDLERSIRIARNSDRSGGGPNLKPLSTNEARMLAVVTLDADRRIAAPNIESLAKIALGDLIVRGEIGHVLDLVEKFGTAPIGETGFVVHYVRAVKAYDEARAAHKAAGGDPEEPTNDDDVVNRYRAAADLLSATLNQPDAAQFKPERIRAAMFAARAAFFAGDFVPASDGFHKAWQIASSIDKSSPEAEEALWLAVVSLDRAASRPVPPTELVRRRTEAGAVFLQTYPESPRAARLLLMRAAAGDISDEEALRVLEGVAKESPMYEAARRQLARILYTRFRSAAAGGERDFAAMRFVSIAEELLALDRRAATRVSGQDIAAAERAITRARQLLDALLGASSPDADRAQSTLELIRTLSSLTGVPIAEFEAELIFRELQIALARGRDDLASAAAQTLHDLPAAQREFSPAAERLLYRRAATLFRSAASEGEKFEPARNIVLYGSRVIDRLGAADPNASTLLGVQSTVAEAAFSLWRQSGGTETVGGDEAMRELSLRLDKLILKSSPSAADALRRVSITAEASNDTQLALECWSIILAASASGSAQWFEARFHALRLIAEIDPARARDLLAQHHALFPDFGPEPWGEKIRDLAARTSAAQPTSQQGTP